MSDSGSFPGSETERGKSPQDESDVSRDASPLPRVRFRRFDALASKPTFEEWKEKHSTRYTAMWQEENGPSAETVLTQLLYAKGELEGLLGNLFAEDEASLTQIETWADEEDWDAIIGWFNDHPNMYIAVQSLVTERQDGVLHQRNMHAAEEKLQESEDKCNETNVNELKFALVVSQREKQGLEEQLQEIKEALRRMHSDMLNWKGKMRQVEASVADCKSTLSPEQNLLINRVSSPRQAVHRDKLLQAAQALVAVTDQLTGNKHRRDNDDEGGSSSGRGLASRRGGRGRGRGQGGHYGRS